MVFIFSSESIYMLNWGFEDNGFMCATLCVYETLFFMKKKTIRST